MDYLKHMDHINKLYDRKRFQLFPRILQGKAFPAMSMLT